MGFWMEMPVLEHDGDGQRLCARGDRCALREYVQLPDGTSAMRAAYTYQPFCRVDRAKIVEAVEELPGLHRSLRDRLGDRPAGQGPKVSGSRTPALIINTAFEALTADVVEIVAGWESRVAHIVHLDDSASDRRSRAYPDVPLQTMCGHLADHMDTLLGLDFAYTQRHMSRSDLRGLPDEVDVNRVDYNPVTDVATVQLALDGVFAGFELLRINGRCRHTLGFTGKDEPVHVPCPIDGCGLVGTVVRPDGADGRQDYAICRACGATFVGPQYANLLNGAYQHAIERQAAS